MSRGIRNHAEEQALWTQFSGSRLHFDREQLVYLYEPFARSIAAQMYKSRVDDSVSFEDYLQYGRIGLLEAVDRFDCGRGVPFSAYSGPRIRGAILNGISKESEWASQNRFWRAQARERVASLASVVARDVDQAALAEIADIAMGLAVGVLLDNLAEANEPADPSQHSDPYAVTETRQLIARACSLIEQLPTQERAVITGHYIEHREFQQVAAQLALTKGRVSQIHAQAILRLRSWLERAPRLDIKL